MAYVQHRQIVFTIYQKPTGKKAVQHTKTGIAYHSKEQRYNEDALITELLPHRPGEPITDPIRLSIEAYFPIPKSKPQWWKEAALAGFIEHTKKPDGDNCLKQIADCLEKLQFIKNDSQIYYADIYKGYSNKPRWVIKIITTPDITREEWREERK